MLIRYRGLMAHMSLWEKDTSLVRERERSEWKADEEWEMERSGNIPQVWETTPDNCPFVSARRVGPIP